jgi:hypothetical protein
LSVSCEFPAALPRRIEYRGASARGINALLFLTILASPFVFIEPSPYEALFAVLALGCLLAGITVDRKVLPLALLLLIWNTAGLAALAPVLHDQTAITFMVISFYLAITAVLYACLFSTDVLPRLATLRTAYILAALVTALIGIAAYFNLIPGADWFTLGGTRARAAFKDPNVYGPFLILPLLFLIDSIIRRGIGVGNLFCALIILFGLFLSFSRGAWAHFLLSAALMLVLMLMTARHLRFRARIIAFGIMAAVAMIGLLVLALSFDSIGAMFQERASFAQEYDVGESGRFGRQLGSLIPLLELPFGFGPIQFGHIYGQDPHNVYLNAFASYGWAGGIAYLALVLVTLGCGLRSVFIPTPWQPYLIAAFAAFAGAAVEGAVIDTDHWRHFYLLLGLIWGLVIANKNAQRDQRRPLPPAS